VDGRDIRSTADLAREIRNRTSDADVTLGVVRDKKSMSVTAKIEAAPDRRARPLRQPRPIRTPSSWDPQSSVDSHQSAEATDRRQR
jgi:hypothetical protein